MKITITEKLWSAWSTTKTESKTFTQNAEIGFTYKKFKFKRLPFPVIFKIKRKNDMLVDVEMNVGLCLCEGNTQNKTLTIKHFETALQQVELSTPTMDAGATYIINIEK